MAQINISPFMFGLHFVCFIGWNSKPTNTSELTIKGVIMSSPSISKDLIEF